MAGRFALREMGTGFLIGTAVIVLMPVLALVAGVAAPEPMPLPLFILSGIFAIAGLGIRVFMRPSFFELTDAGLRICWPLRSRMIPRQSIRSARLLTESEFVNEFGRGVRIGAGGAWGRFGLYRTPKATFSLWASRSDEVVVVDLAGDRPLLITPVRAQEFVAQLA
jgi:hypothetical protein